MPELFIFALLTSAACLGIYMATEKGHALHFIDRLYDVLHRYVRWVLMPLALCPRCMATVWVPLFYYLTFKRFDWEIFILIGAVSFLNNILTTLHFKLK